jgi:hypothetical protein
MAGKWKEVVRLSFKGERFRDHALDLQALSELSQFQKIVAETAKTLWRTANPDRERLPHHFEERVRLCLRKIEDGSATAPLEVYIEDEAQTSFLEPEPHELNDAVELARDVFEAIATNSEFPERLPRSLLPEYAKWGQTLAENEYVEMKIAEKKPVYLTLVSKQKLEKMVETPHESHVEINGEVFETDVKKGRFQILTSEGDAVTVAFNPDQESRVTMALKDHKTVRMSVKGSGEYSPQGKLLRIIQVDALKLNTGEKIYDHSVKPIEDLLIELAKEVPQEEWKKLPDDLSFNLDHYIYGAPKK